MVEATPHLFLPFIDSALGGKPTTKKYLKIIVKDQESRVLTLRLPKNKNLDLCVQLPCTNLYTPLL